MKIKSRIFVFAACLAMSLAASPSKADDDDDELRQLKGKQALQNNCLMCHAAPIIVSQRLSAEQWKTEVTKMIGWGAPVPPEDHAVLLDYLTLEYGEKVPKVRPSRITIRGAEASLEHQNDEGGVNSLSGNRERGQRLFVEHCGKCHSENARGGEVGPNVVNRPILDRWTDFRVLLREGRNRMPSFKQALDRDMERDILWWLETSAGRTK